MTDYLKMDNQVILIPPGKCLLPRHLHWPGVQLRQDPQQAQAGGPQSWLLASVTFSLSWLLVSLTFIILAVGVCNLVFILVAGVSNLHYLGCWRL